MTDLRWEIGHKKGKDWTTMLNNIVEYIVGLKGQHVPTEDQYSRVQNEFPHNCGPIVIAMGKIPLDNHGTMPEQWEKRILCSNSKGSPKGSPSGSGSGSPKVVLEVVPDDEYDETEALLGLKAVNMKG